MEIHVSLEELQKDLEVIRHGAPNEALEEAKRLGHSASYCLQGAQFLEQDGIIRAMLKVFDFPSLSCQDLEALHESMTRLVKAQPRLAAQATALCADPDPRIAFAALVCTKRLLVDDDGSASEDMLDAGAAPAIVSALKHSDAYCRAAAASVVIGRNYIEVTANHDSRIKGPNFGALKAFRKAGLVRALMDVVREGRSDDEHSIRTTGVFSNIKIEVRGPDSTATFPFSEPALYACYTLFRLILTGANPLMDPGLILFGMEVGVEVLRTRQAAVTLVRCLRQYNGDPWRYDGSLRHFDGNLLVSPGKLISTLIIQQDGCSQGAQRRAFCKELLQAGLPEVLPALIRPEWPSQAAAMLEALSSLGESRLPAESLAALAAAIVKYIEEGPGGDSQYVRHRATSCLEKISLGLRNNGLPPAQLSLLCIKRIASVALTGSDEAALAACTFICERALGDKNSEELKAAMSGGFVPGILRVARDGHHNNDTDFPHNLVIDSFILIVQSGEERYILQAVKSGVLPVLELYIGMRQYQKPALTVCAKILEYPWAPAMLREAGFVSSATRAAHSVVELGRWVCTTCPGSGLVADFVDAGLLEKLEKAKSRMKRQPAKQRDVATVIDTLSRLRGLGPPEAGGGPVQELCLVKAKDKVVGTASTSTADGNKRPDPKRDPPTSKNGGKQGGACMQCGKSGEDGVELFLCSRCKLVMYCGRECQRSHWRLHKAKCSALRAEP